nr:nucleotidyltransferase family protein [Allomuricauda sp.]
MSENIPVLILAAGSSSRMEGEIKQLLPYQNTTLLGHAISQAKAVSDKVFVVLGANFEMIQESLSDGVTSVFNPNWESGMGTSISKGVRQILKNDQESRAILIMLADQPLIDSDFLHEMIHLYNTTRSKIVATRYGERFGVPAVFDFSLVSELQTLHEDYGARHIIQAYSEEVLDIDPKGKEFDVDSKKDYIQLIDNVYSKN